jgi:hypothetical protein
LVDLDEDVKPDISNLGSTSRAVEEEGHDEMRVKDFKPSVDVTFKGTYQTQSIVNADAQDSVLPPSSLSLLSNHTPPYHLSSTPHPHPD